MRLPVRRLPFLRAVAARMGSGHFGLIAAGVAFYAMFAVFPGLTATVAIWSLVADPGVITGYLSVAERFLPRDAATLVHDQVMALLQTPRTKLGWATTVSLLVALYSARAGVAALIQGIDVVHRAKPRTLLWGWAVDFGMTFALIIALIVALATVVVMPLLLAYVDFAPLTALNAALLTALPWIAMFVLVMTCLAIVYRFGPNIPLDRPRWILPGLFIAALGWSGVSFALSAYLTNFNSYNRIYGSIGAVIALMMWLYLSVWAVLVGAAINAELEEPSGKE